MFLCCRAMFEIGAHAYFVKKHCMQHLDRNDPKAVWGFLVEINAGSRYMRDKQKAKGVAEPSFGEGPHIGKVIACFDEYFEEERKNKPASVEYGFLSEFCHPNSFAFMNHINLEPENPADPVKFVKPSPEICIQALPQVILSCHSLLHSMGKLLTRVGDEGFKKAYSKFAAIVAVEQ